MECHSGTINIKDRRYQIIKQLGNGAFCKSYLISDTERGDKYILKHVNTNNPDEIRHTVCEIKLLQVMTSNVSMDSYRVNRMYDFENKQFDNSSEFYILLEYINGSDLYDFIINHLSESNPDHYKIIRDLSISILNGLAVLHKLDIAHRDLKPENIMISVNEQNYRAVIIDFNLSCSINRNYISLQDVDPVFEGDLDLYSQNSYKDQVGTKYYVSYEMLTGRIQDFNDLKASDIWSFGVILYLMLFKIFPFASGESWLSLLNYECRYAKWRYRMSRNPTPFNDIINAIFVPVDKRPSISKLINLMESLVF